MNFRPVPCWRLTVLNVGNLVWKNFARSIETLNSFKCRAGTCPKIIKTEATAMAALR